jgi:thiol:disulfide interchange protein
MFATVAWLVWVLVQQLGPPPALAAGERWQPWSSEAVAQARAAGQPVFVDFTAAWCVTCQVNKRATLDSAEMLAEFDAKRVRLLRADWTRRDDRITEELARLGRSGVPVYALYAPGEAAPRLLSEVLTVDEVRTALGQLTAAVPPRTDQPRKD